MSRTITRTRTTTRTKTHTQQQESPTDDVPQVGDPMFIEGRSTETLDDFLKAHKPSKGSPEHGWIWVRTQRGAQQGYVSGSMMSELAQLKAKLDADTKRIQGDKSIGRGNKSKGIKGKKEHREALHEPFRAALKAVAVKYNMRSGKFLFYWDPDSCDANFRKLAEAVISPNGAFHRAGLPILGLKIACQPWQGETTRMACLYLPDSWDEATVRNAWTVIARDVGFKASSFKTDVMTMAGIYSKHPSDIKPSLYVQNDLFSKPEIGSFINANKGTLSKKKESAVQEERRGLKLDSDSDATESEDEAPPAKRIKR